MGMETGLVSFLLGHIAFILAFYYDGGNSARVGYGAGLYLYAAGIVYVIMVFGEFNSGGVCAFSGSLLLCLSVTRVNLFV